MEVNEETSKENPGNFFNRATRNHAPLDVT